MLSLLRSVYVQCSEKAPEENAQAQASEAAQASKVLAA
jgi:hypothetical protein